MLTLAKPGTGLFPSLSNTLSHIIAFEVRLPTHLAKYYLLYKILRLSSRNLFLKLINSLMIVLLKKLDLANFPGVVRILIMKTNRIVLAISKVFWSVYQHHIVNYLFPRSNTHILVPDTCDCHNCRIVLHRNILYILVCNIKYSLFVVCCLYAYNVAKSINRMFSYR